MSEDSTSPLKKYKQSTLKFHPSSPNDLVEASTYQVEPDVQSVTSSQSLKEASFGSLTDPCDCHSKCCEVHFSPKTPVQWKIPISSRERKVSVFLQVSMNFSPGLAYAQLEIKPSVSLAYKGEDTFILTGYYNWKKVQERFSQHASSDVDRESVFLLECLKHDNIQALLDRQISTEQKIHQSNLCTVIFLEVFTPTVMMKWKVTSIRNTFHTN